MGSQVLKERDIPIEYACKRIHNTNTIEYESLKIVNVPKSLCDQFIPLLVYIYYLEYIFYCYCCSITILPLYYRTLPIDLIVKHD